MSVSDSEQIIYNHIKNVDKKLADDFKTFSKLVESNKPVPSVLELLNFWNRDKQPFNDCDGDQNSMKKVNALNSDNSDSEDDSKPLTTTIVTIKRSQLSGDDDESSEEEEEIQAKPFQSKISGSPPKISNAIANCKKESSDDSDESSVMAIVQKSAAITKKQSSDDDSDDSSDDEEPLAKKKNAIALKSASVVEKQVSIDDSVDSSDEEEAFAKAVKLIVQKSAFLVKKPVQMLPWSNKSALVKSSPSKAIPKPDEIGKTLSFFVKRKQDDSSSDSDDIFGEKLAKSNNCDSGKRTTASSNDSYPNTPNPKLLTTNGSKNCDTSVGKGSRKQRKRNTPFRRVDPDAVAIDHSELRYNSFQAKPGLNMCGAAAGQTLGAVKGKNSRRKKNKKKRRNRRRRQRTLNSIKFA